MDAVGYDLGLTEFVTDSDGNKIEAHRFYRDLEPKIATAQRAGKKDRVRALHAKGANRRKDTLHKISTEAVRTRTAIFVGNVNTAALAKTSMAKSVLDAGWSKFRTMLQYKCDDAGVWFAVVNEAFSTPGLSRLRHASRPQGARRARRARMDVPVLRHGARAGHERGAKHPRSRSGAHGEGVCRGEGGESLRSRLE